MIVHILYVFSIDGMSKLHLDSKVTVNELMRVLAYPKFTLDTDEQALLLADFLPYAEII